jgi:hypothetical protein
MFNRTPVLLQTGDVLRAFGGELSVPQLRRLIRRGQLRVAATTPRGGALFDPAEVERVRQSRRSKKCAGPRGMKPRAARPEPAAGGSSAKTAKESSSRENV